MAKIEWLDLIINNEKLIYSIINDYFPWYKDSEDLFSVGALSLEKAIKNYDEDRGVKFSSFAYKYILGELRRYVREDKTIKISRDIQKTAGRIEEAKIFLNQHLMREATLSELSLYLEVDESTLMEAINISGLCNCQSLDEPIKGDEKEISLYDTITKQTDIDLLDLLALEEEIGRLDKREQTIIQSRYYDDLTQSETAKSLGMSQVEVSRAEKKIYQKLKDGLH